MTIYIEKETEDTLDFDYEEIINKVVIQSLQTEKFKHDIEVNVILTNNEEIQCLNKQYRGKDAPTDVLSFPIIDDSEIGDIKTLDEHIPVHFNMDTKELLLGDMIISIEKLKEQAKEYGHSEERELAFLVAHSMLHLFGYDHLQPEEEEIMKVKQNEILDKVGYSR